ncbi:MAG TPA: hypothetical protein VGM19_00080 [Armatimonadota bacterium]|jgi:exopolyphosphatase/guanosine-5'-triphosphate,3'-diphosphate pyrophosphatase
MSSPTPRLQPGSSLVSFDVGSNTVRGLQATLRDDLTLQVTREASRMTALGRGVSSSGRLRAPAIRDTASFVRSFLRSAGPVALVLAAGTAAAREAANGADLVAALREAGAELRVISGAEEGELSYLGAVAAGSVFLGRQPVVADVGGRSTELVTRVKARLGALSLPLGARAWTETYLTDDPPSAGQLRAAHRAARAELEVAHALIAGADNVVVTGGTALAAVVLAGSRWCLTLSQLQTVRRRLMHLSPAERKLSLAFDPDRAEVIVGGLVILEALAQRAPGPCLTISRGGVREGLLVRATGATQILWPTTAD